MIHLSCQGYAGVNQEWGRRGEMHFRESRTWKGYDGGSAKTDCLERVREGRCQIKRRGRQGFEHAGKVNCVLLVKELCLYPLSTYMPLKSSMKGVFGQIYIKIILYLRELTGDPATVYRSLRTYPRNAAVPSHKPQMSFIKAGWFELL